MFFSNFVIKKIQKSKLSQNERLKVLNVKKRKIHTNQKILEIKNIILLI